MKRNWWQTSEEVAAACIVFGCIIGALLVLAYHVFKRVFL